MMLLLKKLFKLKLLGIVKPNKSYEEVYSDMGFFEYTDTGFKFTSKEYEKVINWIEIEQINAFKKDIYLYDLVVMEIFVGGKILTINEETPGWFQLILKLKEVFPDILEDWEINIIQPAFETNYMKIYKKKV